MTNETTKTETTPPAPATSRVATVTSLRGHAAVAAAQAGGVVGITRHGELAAIVATPDALRAMMDAAVMLAQMSLRPKSPYDRLLGPTRSDARAEANARKWGHR